MDLLKKENVQICEEAADWRDAIRISVKPLEEHGYVEPRYKEEIISGVERLGPYIIVAEHVALPHARPEQGVLDTQIAVTLFRKDISFEQEESSARLFITLAAKDSNRHLDVLMRISEILSEDGVTDKILQSKDVETLYHYFA